MILDTPHEPPAWPESQGQYSPLAGRFSSSWFITPLREISSEVDLMQPTCIRVDRGKIRRMAGGLFWIRLSANAEIDLAACGRVRIVCACLRWR